MIEGRGSAEPSLDELIRWYEAIVHHRAPGTTFNGREVSVLKDGVLSALRDLAQIRGMLDISQRTGLELQQSLIAMREANGRMLETLRQIATAHHTPNFVMAQWATETIADIAKHEGTKVETGTVLKPSIVKADLRSVKLAVTRAAAGVAVFNVFDHNSNLIDRDVHIKVNDTFTISAPFQQDRITVLERDLAAAQAESERLRMVLAGANDAITVLSSDVKELRCDAERYRLLRSNDANVNPFWIYTVNEYDNTYHIAEGLDHAVDTALARMRAQHPPPPSEQKEPAMIVEKDLKLSVLAAQNRSRAERWHKGPLTSWTPTEWALAAAGEMGELCNAIKKYNRLTQGIFSNNNPDGETAAVQSIATEIGDVVVYLDLLAQRMGLRLEDCVRDTFNRISEREGMPERL